MQKPEPKLTHMPPHIKQMITNGVDMGTKLALSHLSKEFQTFVEDSPIQYYCLNIRVMPKKVVVLREARFKHDSDNIRESERKTHMMEFHARKRSVLMRNPKSGWKKVLAEKDYRKAAVQYFFGIIRPNTTIKELKWEICSVTRKSIRPRDPEDHNFSSLFPKKQFEEDRQVIIAEMERLHKEFKHQLIVEHVRIDFQLTECQIIKILGFLEPGTLKKITLCIHYPWVDKPFLNLEQISEMEQWKSAKKLSFSSYECDLPIEKWVNLKVLFIRLAKPQPTMKAMLEMFVSRLTFEHLNVECLEDLDQTGVKEYLDDFEHLRTERFDIIRLPSDPTKEICIEYTTRAIEIRRWSLSYFKGHE